MNVTVTGKRILRVLRDLLILVAIGNSIVFLMERELVWDGRTFLTNCLFSIIVGYPAWKGSALITGVLEKRLPWLKYPIKRLVVQTVGMIGYAAVIILLVLLAWVILSPEITFQNISPFAIKSLKIITICMLVSLVLTNGVLFFLKWREAALQQEELKRAHLSLQFQTLKAQLKPHFLFNSLSSLEGLIHSDPDRATQFVHKLSDVYRYVLDLEKQDLVPLSEEVKFLRNYVFLQEIRFGKNLGVNIDLERTESVMIVPLALQMMVENAIKHNEISDDHPLGIRIAWHDDEGIQVTNNLNPKEVLEPTTGIGMENLRKRITYFTSKSLETSETSGEFMANIPVIKNEAGGP